MWTGKINSFLLFVVTNQIICDVAQDDANQKSITNLHLQNNIDRAIIVRPLRPPYTVPPFLKPQPPIILTLGVPNRLPPLGFPSIPMVLPLDYYKNFGIPFDKDKTIPTGLHPGFGENFIPGFSPGFALGLNQNFAPLGAISSQNFQYDDGKNEHFVSLMDQMQGHPSVGPNIKSVQYFGPNLSPDRPVTEDVDDQKPSNSATPEGAPHIEIFKSLGYSLPSEVIFSHPVNYAKEYLLDSATSTSVKNISQKLPKVTHFELLTGEEDRFTNSAKESSERDEILTQVESKRQNRLNEMKKTQNQDFYSTRPVAFENKNDKPKNIFEIITAEKVTPKEVDMTEEELKVLQGKADKRENMEVGNDLVGRNVVETANGGTTTENIENFISVSQESINQEDDSDLRVLELEKRNDQLLLLLSQEQDATAKKFPKKRSTDESFNVNIGAGYGVGIDQNTPFLPESTTQINSTNHLTNLLKNEAIVIGTYPEQLPNFDSDMIETKTVPIKKETKNIEVKRGVMNMKEIQEILKNVDDKSEYSKIVQVVKVPAIYEIHLEKSEIIHQKAPKQYVQQINNLAKRPQNHKPTNVVYGTKNKDIIQIDKWQRNKQSNKRKNKSGNPSIGYQQFQPQAPSRVYENTNNYREKKNTYHQQSQQYHHQPQYYPVYPSHQTPVQQNSHVQESTYPSFQTPTPQQQSVYTTLTHTVPYPVRRKFYQDTHRSSEDNNDLVYGAHKEKVLNPEEINITIQPGTTMVTVPRLEPSDKRNFIEEDEGCKKRYSQHVVPQPPELIADSSNIDNIYFTTRKPMEKGIQTKHKSRGGYYMQSNRRSDIRPVKYVLFINKIVRDDW